MIELRVRDTLLRLDFTFLAVLLLFLVLDQSGFALMGLYACLIHELGHLLAMLFVGCSPDRILFYGAGVKITSYQEYKLPFAAQLTVLSFGSLTNLIAFAVLYICGSGNLPTQMFGVIHLLIGLFNLLPLPIFDGGRILALVLGRILSEQAARRLSRIVGIVLLTLLLGLSIVLFLGGHINFTAVATIGYLCFVALFMSKG